MKIHKTVHSFLHWLANLGCGHGWPKWYVCVMSVTYSYFLVYLVKVYYLIYFL